MDSQLSSNKHNTKVVSRFCNRRIHFIGIGGCGMSGLARMLLDAGAIVSGSDIKLNAQMKELAARGAAISIEQNGKMLRPDLDLVVRTAAVHESNAEYQATCAMGLRQMKYAHLLGEVMAERLGVAVSGTHGKTTTTSMISYALLECGADPSFVIGGTVGQLGGSSRSGAGQAFVVEACEFDRSFHSLWPQVAVITNTEEDHLDCYPGGLAEIEQSFRIFAQRVPIDGRIIANGQDDSVRRALEGLNVPVAWVGFDDFASLEWAVSSIGMRNGCYRGEVYQHGKAIARLNLSVPGRHNLFNATAALAACEACGMDVQRAAEAIGQFLGADRRMTEMGQANGALVVDDYGHHPTEIRTTLRALREKYHPRRLICVFQPHQHSRTRFLLDDFAASFCDADLTVVPEIYSVRDSEADRMSVSTRDLVERIEKHGQRAMFVPDLSQIVADLRREVGSGDLVVTMGAGNVCDVGRELVGG
jgi:UDP-N-acetylmuramate--alanine ligase